MTKTTFSKQLFWIVKNFQNKLKLQLVVEKDRGKDIFFRGLSFYGADCTLRFLTEIFLKFEISYMLRTAIFLIFADKVLQTEIYLLFSYYMFQTDVLSRPPRPQSEKLFRKSQLKSIVAIGLRESFAKTKVGESSTVSALKKSDTTKNVRFFSNFSWWFKMLL